MEKVYRLLGQRIRSARKRKRVTQQGLAEALEITRTSVTNIERGHQRLPVQLVYDIAEVLEEDPLTFFPEQWECH